MANKAMKERHWDRIATVTGHKFDVESENFLLRNIMEAPLLENKEDIEVSKSHVMHSHFMSRSYSFLSQSKIAKEPCSECQARENLAVNGGGAKNLRLCQAREKSGTQFKLGLSSQLAGLGKNC